MKTLFGIRSTALAVLLAGSAISGCAILMPTPEKPYQLARPGDETPAVEWTWEDARQNVSTVNVPTNEGLRFGDAVMHPRPFVQFQTEFARAVAKHEAAEELRQKLRGKTLRMDELSLEVGLWARLSQRQEGAWEFVRVRAVVNVDGSRYEARDIHRFDNSETPSPVSQPLRNAAESLAQQIHLF